MPAAHSAKSCVYFSSFNSLHRFFVVSALLMICESLCVGKMFSSLHTIKLTTSRKFIVVFELNWFSSLNTLFYLVLYLICIFRSSTQPCFPLVFFNFGSSSMLLCGWSSSHVGSFSFLQINGRIFLFPVFSVGNGAC